VNDETTNPEQIPAPERERELERDAELDPELDPELDAELDPERDAELELGITAARDLASMSAHEIALANIVDLMTAAAVKLGLYEGGEADRDLADSRILIDALAGLIDGAAPHLGSQHAAPVRDGLASLQAAFAEYSPVPDAPGEGPGEKYGPTARRRGPRAAR
jgi:hypothetical protein